MSEPENWTVKSQTLARLAQASKELLDAIDYVDAAHGVRLPVEAQIEAAKRTQVAIEKLRALIEGRSWEVCP